MWIISTLTQALGWIINLKKSEMTPTQGFSFIGVVYDLVRGLMFPPEARFLTSAQTILPLTHNPVLPLQAWRSILGTIQSMVDQVPLGRLHSRPLVHWLNASILDRHNPRELITIDPSSLRMLLWWTDLLNVLPGVRLGLPAPTLRLSTDSSSTHWGAHLMPISLAQTPIRDLPARVSSLQVGLPQLPSCPRSTGHLRA
jgi:hypothetical protein